MFSVIFVNIDLHDLMGVLTRFVKDFSPMFFCDIFTTLLSGTEWMKMITKQRLSTPHIKVGVW